MAEGAFPSSKPPQPTANGSGGPPTFPATKSQLYGASRPAYRPQPVKPHPRSRRRCGCCFCLWLSLVILALVLLAAIAGAVIYLIYRPHRPTFTVTSLRLSTLNLTASGKLTSRLDIAVTASNPNRKLVLLYGPSAVSASSSGAGIGEGSLPGFAQSAKNSTALRTTISSSGEVLDATTATDLRRRRSVSLPIEIRLETKVGVKIGRLRTKKIRIRVTCSGIDVPVPGPRANATAATSPDASCRVKIRIKIWKWTV